MIYKQSGLYKDSQKKKLLEMKLLTFLLLAIRHSHPV